MDKKSNGNNVCFYLFKISECNTNRRQGWIKEIKNNCKV